MAPRPLGAGRSALEQLAAEEVGRALGRAEALPAVARVRDELGLDDPAAEAAAPAVDVGAGLGGGDGGAAAAAGGELAQGLADGLGAQAEGLDERGLLESDRAVLLAVQRQDVAAR